MIRLSEEFPFSEIYLLISSYGKIKCHMFTQEDVVAYMSQALTPFVTKLDVDQK